jgi:large subunit ribosomal protein L15
MNLGNLVKTKTKRSQKRVGRGYGSGKGGHASGRGQKGMKARNKPKLTFSGTKIKKSWLKRLPLWRGKGRLKSSRNPASIRLDMLDAHFKPDEAVTVESLVKKGLVKRKQANSAGVKIIGGGKITKKLSVKLPCTRSAAAQIEKAGGTVDNGSEAN